MGEGTPRKLATGKQPQFPRKVADFKQATGFQISRATLRKLTFGWLLVSSQVGVSVRQFRARFKIIKASVVFHNFIRTREGLL
jgi:hypothetical protein